jgi:hypothetical protein
MSEIENTPPVAASPYVNMVKSVFHFKSEKLRDDKGEIIADSKGPKHPSVEMYLPVPKQERLAEMLADTTGKFAKEVDLVMTAISSVIFGVARGQINDYREANKDATVTTGVLNYDKLDLTAIANMPKSERGSFVPSDEDMKTFLDSYLAIMPDATSKPVERIKKHVEIIATTFKKHRSQKDMLEFFVDALAIYVTAAPADAVEDNLEVIEYLNSRLSRMLKVEERVTMDDL